MTLLMYNVQCIMYNCLRPRHQRNIGVAFIIHYTLYIVNFKLLSLDLFFYGFDFENDFLKVLLEPFDFLFDVGHE